MLPTILSAYPHDCQPEASEFLGNAGGFSGALLWKLKTVRAVLCLRRWPANHPSSTTLQWIHRVLAHVASQGSAPVPVPIKCSHGNTFLLVDGHHWELTPWMPGEANYHHDATPQKLKSAMQTLAEFHRAASDVQISSAVSRSILERLEFTKKLLDSDLQRWQEKISHSSDNVHYDRCHEVLSRAMPLLPTVLSVLQPAANTTFSLQPCLRDIWHDHVLFQREEVSGLIDFGAMRTECVAGDVARLLGSLVGDDQDGWEEGLASYEQVRPLSHEERRVLLPLDQANVVLSGMNWIRWLIVERRTFEDSHAVDQRLDAILSRLRIASETGGFSAKF